MKIIFIKFTFLLALIIQIKCQRPSGSLNDLLGQEFNVTGPGTYELCGTGKICVPFYNCRNDTNTLNTDGQYLLDIRFDEGTPCASYLDTCCTIADAGNKDSGKPSGSGGTNEGTGGSGGTGVTGGSNNSGGSGGSTVVIPEFPTVKPPVYKKGCGQRNINGLQFKITGNTAGETEYAEFPWMVAVLRQEAVNDEIYNIYECGGSIIHPQVVMTAAHCVRKFETADLLVRAGEWDTQTKEEPFKEQDRQVIEMILHEKFSKAGLHNDIALLLTAQPFIFGADVNSVCLPPSNLNFNGINCFVTGWGKDQYGAAGKYQVILKKVEVPVVANDICQNELQNTELGKTFKLHESFICAGGKGKDACKGDGGGPLSCPIPNEQNRFYQSGIVAWGIGCNGAHPSTYASTTYLRDWIDQVMDARVKCQQQQLKKIPSGSFDDLVSIVWNNPPIDNKPNNSNLNVITNVQSNSNQNLNENSVNQPIRGASLYEKCDENKICVPFYNCKNGTDKINFDGENLIDIRFDDAKPCAKYLEKCCSLENNQGGNIVDSGTSGNVGSTGTEGLSGATGSSGIGGSHGTGESSGVITLPITNVKTKPYEYKKGCGHRNPGGILFRIIGNKGGETEYAEFPWMVAILEQEIVGDEMLNIYQCGGSIIHPNVILTAAHCVHTSDVNNLIVRAGEWDTQTKDEPHEEQDRQVIEIILHEKFGKLNLRNDVALLFIAQPFIFAENVNSVCLPPPNHNFNQNRCFVTGWGKDKYGQAGQYQVILKKIEVPIVSNDQCQENLRETRLGKFFQLHQSFICAGGEIGKDACKGDGGGPLSCPISGQNARFYQAGIVAWGIGCGGSNPGAYGNIAYFRNWIDEIMNSKGYDTSYYTAI